MTVDTVRDFEDLLVLLDKHEVRYLVIGGLAFTFHARPRYTKDMDLWLDHGAANVRRANDALAEFGSPFLLDPGNKDEILQLGVAPSRIDILRRVKGARFQAAWKKRIRGRYGRAPVNWIDLESLIRIKQRISHPRHQEDARVLREVRKRRRRRSSARDRRAGSKR
jgi:hypothetical protein